MEWIKGIDFDGHDTFDNQPRKNFTYVDTDGNTLSGGWYRHHENFTVAIIPEAGHMVPVTEPVISKKMV